MKPRPKTFAELPDAVAAFLVSLDVRSELSNLAKKYGIADESVSDLSQLAEDIVFGELEAVRLPETLTSQFGVPKERAGEAAADYARLKLFPISDEVGLDLDAAVKSWGADPASFSSVKKVAATVVAPPADSAPRAGAGFSDPVLQHRLELIVASYREGVRTREQAVAVLMRPVKTGGLELGEQEAADVLALAGVAPSEPPSEPAAAPEPKPTAEPIPSAAEVPVATGAKADAFTKEDEAEIATVAEQKKDAMATPRLITDTKAAADKIVADAKLSFATGELRTRFDHIIDARLRDVRDGFETRAKLEDAAEKGGVGLSGAQLVAVMELVEEMDAMHHKALAQQMAEKKEAHAAQKAELAETAAKVQEQEAQVMAKRYAELTGKAPTELVAPVVPSRPTAMPTAEAVKQRDEKIDTSKVKAAIEAAKAPAPVVTPVMSASSIPTTAVGRPKVEDIRFERTLAGPIEELRLLTLVDFRRLSKDPRQAILRVQDKVELVGQDGYEQRIAAIRAWRESPLSREYVAVSREALLAGTSIAKVLADKRAAGQDVLTDDELKAIVDLNGILRF